MTSSCKEDHAALFMYAAVSRVAQYRRSVETVASRIDRGEVATAK